MKDWSGTRVYVDALTVPCPFCSAPIGQECQAIGKPLTAFPAHLSRIRNSQKVSAK